MKGEDGKLTARNIKEGSSSFHPSSLILHPCSKGFTLIELLVVLIVIGIASSLIGIFVYSGIDNVRLNTFAREISSTLRYARTHAVSEKKTYSFIIHGKEKAYGLYAGSGPVIYKQFPSDKLQAALKGSSEEDIRIDFSLYGSSTGGTIEVKGTDGPIWHISVNRVTGKVEVGKVKDEG